MAIDSVALGDFKALDDLKLTARTDAKSALPAVAKQFEAIFLQAMLKSMRMGEHFLDDDSPFKSENQQTFQAMLDGQYASAISDQKGIGFAEYLSNSMGENPLVTMPRDPSRLGLGPTTTDNVGPRPNLPSDEADTHTTNSVDDFVKSLWPYAKQAASALGLDPKILIAQAALETGWGKSVAKDAEGASSNNIFNIKSTNPHDDAVKVKTTEYVANTPLKVTASFRKYATVEHSFDDYVSLIQNNARYADAKNAAMNPEGYVKALHTAGYATDPTYSDKILSIYNGSELDDVIQRNGLTQS